MRQLLAFLCLLFGLGACQQPAPGATATDQVNAVVGNTSYVAAFGRQPGADADENTRIRTHLAFAEQQLRRQPVAGLSPALAQRRTQVLDLLHQYWTAGAFPRNYDYPAERKPCFIDRNGRLCAVGYLVAQTAGRTVAESINQEHQYDLIADMRTPALAEWVAASGLSKAECALIQPTYGYQVPVRQEVPVATSYAVPSMLWSGLNVAFAAVNAGRLNQATAPPKVAWLGLISGAGQIACGALNLPADQQTADFGWGVPPPIKSFAAERTVSYVNIGVGTATLALSAWNLLSHRPAARPRTTLSMLSYPADPSSAGLAWTRRF